MRTAVDVLGDHWRPDGGGFEDPADADTRCFSGFIFFLVFADEYSLPQI